MVLSCHALPDGRLHQPRQGRKHIDGGVDLGKQKGVAEGRVQSFLSFLPLLVSPPPGALKRLLLTPPTDRGSVTPPSSVAHSSRAWACRCLRCAARQEGGGGTGCDIR